MLPGFLAIDEYLGLLVNTLKVQFYYLALGCGKRLAIFALATRIPTAIGTAGTSCRIRGISNSPVVG